MSDAVVTLLAGLGGALIGATAALTAQAHAARETRRADRRRELVDLVARFWDAADRLWRASQGLDIAVMSLTAAEGAQHVESARIYEGRRQDSMAAQHAAETDGHFLVAQLRLLYPDVAEPARALLVASNSFDHAKRAELRAARQAALETYEDAARRLLNRSS